jgi:hypothetical protein
MYIIKLTIKATDPNNKRVRYKKTLLKGIYLPKGAKRAVKRKKIEEHIYADIMSEMREKNPHLVLAPTATVEYFGTDFILREDEIERKNGNGDDT